MHKKFCVTQTSVLRDEWLRNFGRLDGRPATVCRR